VERRVPEDRLAYGVFLGALSRSVAAGGFQIDLRTATLPPEAVEEHGHDEAHFILTLADGYRSLAGAGPLRRGALIYNPPGVEHRDCYDVAGGGFLAISTPALPPSGSEPRLLVSATAGRLARRLVGTCIRPGPGVALAAESLALDLASWVTADEEVSTHPPDWLIRAEEAIGDLCRTAGLEVRAIADLVGVHPVHLARRYRHHFGQSPGAAIRQRRADAAAALLAGGADPISVAQEAGYADQSHLTRAFAAAFAVTPARYREAFRA
jgi:AraC family transcriptional regulator